MWDLERTLLQEMGAVAAQAGVTIAVENARPYLDASPYCYGEFLQSLAEMIVQVNHPRVGITLDLGPPGWPPAIMATICWRGWRRCGHISGTFTCTTTMGAAVPPMRRSRANC